MNKLFQNPFAGVRSIVALGVVCMLLFALISCEKNDIPFDEPINVPFTVVSKTEGTSDWRWTWGTEPNRGVIIINSNRELRRHIICTGEDYFPAIDFSNYTLLLVRATFATTGGHFKPLKLQQLSSRTYLMTICTLEGISQAVSHRHIAVTTRRLDRNARVERKLIPFDINQIP